MNHSQQLSSLFGALSGRQHRPAGALAPRTPLVVAIHGGTYTSAYFDVPGASLFEQAAALRIPLLAPDRPGYAGSAMLPAAQMTIQGQAQALLPALADAWQRHGEGTAGIVLIGHSIGGAIAAAIAAAHGSAPAAEVAGIPLLGLAVSGVCLHTPPEHKPLWEALPDTPTVEMPPGVKEAVMFGPEGSFDPSLPVRSAIANTAAPKAELVDIVSRWQDQAPDVLGRIRVPVHYRQAEVDHLWICGQAEVDGFAAALSASPRVDAAMMRHTGHCMDLHHVGRALQLQQLAFACQCAAEHPLA